MLYLTLPEPRRRRALDQLHLAPMTPKHQSLFPCEDDELGAACLLTSGDIARLLDVDLKTVHNWVKLEHLSGLKTKGGHLRFHRSEVIRFMRRFGYPVPAKLGGPAPRVAVVSAVVPAPFRGVGLEVRVECFERIFDATLAAASGGFEMIVLDLDAVTIQHAVALVAALRRRDLTRGVVVVGQSSVPGVREAFIRQGADVVVADERELAPVLRLFTGSAA